MIDIIKIGGNVIDNEDDLNQFLIDLSKLSGHKILVHGGGKLATRLCEKMDIPVQMIEGRRVTDVETLKIAVMVYAGWINKGIVAKLQSYGCSAIGLCGADANTIPAVRREPLPIDYGFVGDVNPQHINIDFINILLQQNIIPVFCAITYDGQGNLLNSNADGIASSLAISLSANQEVRLTYCFEKKGVLFNPQNDESVIQEINKRSYHELKQMGIINAGMIPKIDNAFKAIDAGVKQVVIKHSADVGKQHTGTLLT